MNTIEITTERLILKTNCTVVNGEFVFPQKQNISILDLQPNKSEDGGFAIYLKESDVLIGHIGLRFYRKPYELDVSIDEQYWKQGYMTEAQSAVLKWIFDNCHTDQITALVGPISPEASHKLCKHNGFHEAREGNEDWWVLDREDFVYY